MCMEGPGNLESTGKDSNVPIVATDKQVLRSRAQTGAFRTLLLLDSIYKMFRFVY